MMDVQELFPRIRRIVADLLAVDESEVELKHGLVADLGAESIDFLDLVFRLEKAFGVKIPRGQIEKEARGALGNEEFEKDGVLSDKGIEQLKRYLSEVPAERIEPGLKINEIPTLFTVETFCKLVARAKEKQGA